MDHFVNITSFVDNVVQIQQYHPIKGEGVMYFCISVYVDESKAVILVQQRWEKVPFGSNLNDVPYTYVFNVGLGLFKINPIDQLSKLLIFNKCSSCTHNWKCFNLYKIDLEDDSTFSRADLKTGQIYKTNVGSV